MRVVTVTMNPAADLIVELPSLRLDAVNKARAERLFCGGKGINVSLVLALLGIESSACGFFGRDNAGMFETFCRDNRIVPAFDLLPGPTRTNVKLAIDGRPATDINLPGLPVPPEAFAALGDRLFSMAAPDCLFLLCGSLPPGVTPAAYAGLIERLGRTGARVYLDASGEALARGLAAGPDLAKPNLGELAELEGAERFDAASAATAAGKWLARGCKALAVSLGGDGAMWISEGTALRASAGSVEAINMVGAGDSFLAGLVYGLLEGWEPMRRLAFATALSAHWVEKMDRLKLDRRRVDELARNIRITHLPAVG